MATQKIETGLIADSAVTTAKLADNSVTAAKIAAGSLDDQVKGISSSADAVAITIDSSGNVGIGGSTITDVNLLNLQGSGASKNIGIVFNDTNTSKIFSIQNGGSALKFFDYTASQERMRIDSSGNVGIGNTVASSMDAGANNLVVGTGSGTEGMTIYSGTANSGVIYFADGASGDDRFRGQIGYSHGDNSLNFRTNASSSANMTLDASGNVGIGNSSPSSLYWPNGSTGGLFLQAGGLLSAYNAGTNLSQNWYYNAGEKFIGNGGASRYVQSGQEHIWSHSTTVNSSGAGANLTWAESMRIDASGRLLVGTTDADPQTSSSNSGVQIGDGYVFAARAAEVAIFNRQSTDGNIVELRKNGSTVGVIGTEGTELTIGTTTAGLQFLGSEGKIRPFNVSTNSVSNGIVDLGRSNAKFKDLYLSGAIKMDSDLDDYEEGNWTPQLSNGTSMGSNSATYTKIGNLVTVRFDLTNGSGSGTDRIYGLPFDTVGHGSFHITWNNIGNTNYIGGYSNSGDIQLIQSGTTSSWTLPNGNRILGFGIYYTSL